MVIECNEAGIDILRNTAKTVDYAAETILYDTNKNLQRCDDYSEELGPHVEDLKDALEYIKLNLDSSTETIKTLVLKLNGLADSYEEIVSMNPFGQLKR